MSQTLDPIIKCPHCPKTWDRDAEMHNQPAVSAAAQHVMQSSDHPNLEFSEAKDQVLRYNQSAGDGEGGDTQPADGDPSIAPPGGTTNEFDGDPARSMPEVPNQYKPSCPNCGEEMTQTTKGVTYSGYYNGEEITLTTDGKDYRCPDCDVLLTTDNQTVSDIEA